ncbi:DNA alkylation repair protein [Paenarthrobacter sp.]|uniref:DNA alkylation repair protein n=1 Tax=Paenarthrobacter sp. TaxID=1931993 RepID=UPI0028120D96|nr:DNA alkylation repair protein [Paenarthrobacter sp.]
MGAMDELINSSVVTELRSILMGAEPGVELPTLERSRSSLAGQRLRQRVDIVRDALLEDMPAGYSAVHRIMLDALDDPRFTGWMVWPATEVVTGRALQSGSLADFDAALTVLSRLTERLTGEFAVRDLIAARPERAIATMQTWTNHDDENVRRLATEGSRAYLPWAKRVPWLVANPTATQGILEATYRDPTEYVRRSAANHLNDLSRIDPQLVIATALRWSKKPDDTTPKVIRHGLRTLVKQGNPEALALLGYSGGKLVVREPRILHTSVAWDGTVEFSAEVVNEGPQPAKAAIDYSIGFQRANGTVTAKTFKLTSRQLAPGEAVTVTKTHSFRPITTRSYYPGQHYVVVQANGLASVPANFVLNKREPS